MSLTKKTESQVTVLPDFQLQVRTTTFIMEDGAEISKSYHRKVISVGADTAGEDEMVIEIADKLHTEERKALLQ